MCNIKSIFYKFNEVSTNDESEKMKDLLCFTCSKTICYGEWCIKDENLKVYCSEKCYLKQLNSKYY